MSDKNVSDMTPREIRELAGATDPVAAYLTEARQRAEGAAMPWSPPRCTEMSQADVPRLLAAVEAVLALHVPDVEGFEAGNWCTHCTFSWPCSTCRAISAALLGEAGPDA